MSPLAAILIFLGIALFSLLALLGERQFAQLERLPVHWGSGARPDIFAPRRVALSIFPALGLLLLLALAFGGQPVYLLASVMLAVAACNLIFFRAIGRTLQEQ